MKRLHHHNRESTIERLSGMLAEHNADIIETDDLDIKAPFGYLNEVVILTSVEEQPLFCSPRLSGLEGCFELVVTSL